jgi:hypothetical protein
LQSGLLGPEIHDLGAIWAQSKALGAWTRMRSPPSLMALDCELIESPTVSANIEPAMLASRALE